VNDVALPLPKVWRVARHKDKWYLYLGLAFTAAFSALMLATPPSRDSLGLVIGIGFTLVLVLLLADVFGIMKIVARRRAISERVRSIGLLKRSHQAILIPESIGMQILRIATVVILAAWFFGGWLFGDIVSDASGFRGAIGGALWNLYVFLGPVLAIAALATIPARFILRKRPELGIGLSRDGVYYWTWFRCVHYRWEWVSEVVPSHSAAATLVISEKDVWRDVRTDPEENWLADAERVRRKKFGDAIPESYEERARQARFLQNRGFTMEQIRRVLKGDIEEQ
jgi:hypothetical protein